jgi:hypothetical protein
VLRARSSDMSRVVEVPALEAAPSLPSGKDEYTRLRLGTIADGVAVYAEVESWPLQTLCRASR